MYNSNLEYNTRRRRFLKILQNNNSIPTVYYSMVPNSHLEMIKFVMKTHDDLCDVSELLEEFFSLLMMVIVTICFTIIVFNAYYILEAIFGGSSQARNFGLVEFITFFAYQGFEHAVILISVVYCSSSTAREVRMVLLYIVFFYCFA